MCKNSLKTRLYKTFSVFLCLCFISTSVLPPNSYAQPIKLPAPGAFVNPTPVFTPAMIRAISIYPEDPLKFDFIMDQGDSGLKNDQLKQEYETLVKYFLASLTVPEEELWVNLSPKEKDRVIPDKFGETEMGRDLLAQDYILKQLTASLMYPEEELGQEFWQRVYKKSQQLYGHTNIPVNTFNKVWIVPESATVYEDGRSAFVAESKLKVMLEAEYEEIMNDEKRETLDVRRQTIHGTSHISHLTSNVIKEVIIPEIEKEVNEGEHFAKLRQIYNALILATWYKQNLKESLLGQVYVNQNKTVGVDHKDAQANEKIYESYIEAFKKGVYDYIKEEYDPATKDFVARKYVSGGAGLQMDVFESKKDFASLSTKAQENTINFLDRLSVRGMDKVTTNILGANEAPNDLIFSDAATLSEPYVHIKDDIQKHISGVIRRNLAEYEEKQILDPLLELLSSEAINPNYVWEFVKYLFGKLPSNPNESDITRIFEGFRIWKLLASYGLTLSNESVNHMLMALEDIYDSFGQKRFRDPGAQVTAIHNNLAKTNVEGVKIELADSDFKALVQSVKIAAALSDGHEFILEFFLKDSLERKDLASLNAQTQENTTSFVDQAMMSRLKDYPRTAQGLSQYVKYRYDLLLDQMDMKRVAFSSTVDLIDEVKSNGFRVGLVSSAKTARKAVRNAGLYDKFETIVDGQDVVDLGLRAKPSGDSYLEAAKHLEIDPKYSVVIEDSQAGIQAGKDGGFGLVIGIDRYGRTDDLRQADVIVKDLNEVSLTKIKEWLAERTEGDLQGVLFDNDGVTLDSEQLHYMNVRIVIDEYFIEYAIDVNSQIPEFTWDDYAKHFMAKGSVNGFTTYFEEIGISLTGDSLASERKSDTDQAVTTSRSVDVSKSIRSKDAFEDVLRYRYISRSSGMRWAVGLSFEAGGGAGIQISDMAGDRNDVIKGHLSQLLSENYYRYKYRKTNGKQLFEDLFSDLLGHATINAVDEMYLTFDKRIESGAMEDAQDHEIEIPISVKKYNHFITITVQDNGRGIAESVLRHWKDGKNERIDSTKIDHSVFGGVGEGVQTLLDRAKGLGVTVKYSTRHDGEHWVLIQDEFGERFLDQGISDREGTVIEISIPLDPLGFAVTGATGFVGTKLSSKLLNRLAQTRALVWDDREAEKLTEDAPEFEQVKGALSDLENLRALVKDNDVLINLAGDTRTGVQQSDVELSAQILETNVFGAGLALLLAQDENPEMRKIFLSSFDVDKVPQEASQWVEVTAARIVDYLRDYHSRNGVGMDAPQEFFQRIAQDLSDQSFQTRPYPMSKALMDRVLVKLSTELKIRNTIILRIMGPIGIEMLRSRNSGLMLNLISAILESDERPDDEKVTIFQDASSSLIAVDDVVDVLMGLSEVELSQQEASQPLILELAGERIDWKDVAEMVRQTAVELDLPQEGRLKNVKFIDTPPGFVNVVATADLDPLNRVLGQVTKITPIRDVIADLTAEKYKIDKNAGYDSAVGNAGARTASLESGISEKAIKNAWEEIEKKIERELAADELENIFDPLVEVVRQKGIKPSNFQMMTSYLFNKLRSDFDEVDVIRVMEGLRVWRILTSYDLITNENILLLGPIFTAIYLPYVQSPTRNSKPIDSIRQSSMFHPKTIVERIGAINEKSLLVDISEYDFEELLESVKLAAKLSDEQADVLESGLRDVFLKWSLEQVEDSTNGNGSVVESDGAMAALSKEQRLLNLLERQSSSVSVGELWKLFKGLKNMRDVTEDDVWAMLIADKNIGGHKNLDLSDDEWEQVASVRLKGTDVEGRIEGYPFQRVNGRLVQGVLAVIRDPNAPVRMPNGMSFYPFAVASERLVVARRNQKKTEGEKSQKKDKAMVSADLIQQHRRNIVDDFLQLQQEDGFNGYTVEFEKMYGTPVWSSVVWAEDGLWVHLHLHNQNRLQANQDYLNNGFIFRMKEISENEVILEDPWIEFNPAPGRGNSVGYVSLSELLSDYPEIEKRTVEKIMELATQTVQKEIVIINEGIQRGRKIQMVLSELDDAQEGSATVKETLPFKRYGISISEKPQVYKGNRFKPVSFQSEGFRLNEDRSVSRVEDILAKDEYYPQRFDDVGFAMVEFLQPRRDFETLVKERRQSGVTPEGIRNARALLKEFGVVEKSTPLRNVQGIDSFVQRLFGVEHFINVWFKDETENPTGSYKDRSPISLFSEIKREVERIQRYPEDKTSVLKIVSKSVSTGNHGRANVAAVNAAKAYVERLGLSHRFDLTAEVTMGLNAMPHKVEAIKRLGGTVRQYVDSEKTIPIYDYKQAEDLVFEEVRKSSDQYKPWFRQTRHADEYVVSGYSVIAYEIIEQLEREGVDIYELNPNELAVSVPLGSGGFLSGVAELQALLGDKVDIFGVSAPEASMTFRSFEENKFIREADTNPNEVLTDGNRATPEKFSLTRIPELTQGVMLITEEDALYATALLQMNGIMVEPTSGLALALALIDEDHFRASLKNIVVPLSSKNISESARSEVSKIVRLGEEAIMSYFKRRRLQVRKAIADRNLQRERILEKASQFSGELIAKIEQTNVYPKNKTLKQGNAFVYQKRFTIEELRTASRLITDTQDQTTVEADSIGQPSILAAGLLAEAIVGDPEQSYSFGAQATGAVFREHSIEAHDQKWTDYLEEGALTVIARVDQSRKHPDIAGFADVDLDVQVVSFSGHVLFTAKVKALVRPQEAEYKELPGETGVDSDAAMFSQEYFRWHNVPLTKFALNVDLDKLNEIGVRTVKDLWTYGDVYQRVFITEGLGDIAVERLLKFAANPDLYYLGDKVSKRSIPAESKDVGGIDLNPKNLDIKIRRNGQGVALPFNLQNADVMRINGFVPVIINITPITAFPLLSNINTQNDQRHASESPFSNRLSMVSDDPNMYYISKN